MIFLGLTVTKKTLSKKLKNRKKNWRIDVRCRSKEIEGGGIGNQACQPTQTKQSLSNSFATN